MTPRVLLIAPSYASSPRSGGGQRTHLFFEALASRYDVDVALVDDTDATGAERNFPDGAARYLRLPRLSARGPARLLQSFDPILAERVATVINGRRQLYAPSPDPRAPFGSYDVVVSRYLRPAARAGALMPGGPPVLIDIDDRDDAVLDVRLAETRNPFFRAVLKRHRDTTQQIFDELTRAAAHLWFVAEEDAASVAHPSVSLLPNIPFAHPASAPPPCRNGVFLFVGSAGHRPNPEGVIRFVDTVWPLIIEAAPHARLRIVGSWGWRDYEKRLNAPGVEVVGVVKDLDEEYANAEIAVCPVFEGGGSKIKVLEALAYNRPVIAARHSARGFAPELLDGPVQFADDPAAMAAMALNLLADPADAARRAAIGRTVVLRKYSRAAFQNGVLAPLAQLLDAPSGARCVSSA